MDNISFVLVREWKIFFVDEDGATAVEYGLLLSAITVAALSAQAGLGTAVFNMYVTASGAITSAMS